MGFFTSYTGGRRPQTTYPTSNTPSTMGRVAASGNVGTGADNIGTNANNTNNNTVIIDNSKTIKIIIGAVVLILILYFIFRKKK